VGPHHPYIGNATPAALSKPESVALPRTSGLRGSRDNSPMALLFPSAHLWPNQAVCLLALLSVGNSPSAPLHALPAPLRG